MTSLVIAPAPGSGLFHETVFRGSFAVPNTNAPFGLRPIGLNDSPATPSFSIQTRKIAPGNTTKAFRGDGMQNLNTGYVSTVAAAAVALSQWTGIFWGCEYLSIAAGRPVFSTTWPGGDASGDVSCQLIPTNSLGVEQLFIVQATSTPFTFVDIGKNCDISYTLGTAFSAYSKSGLTLNRATIGTAVTLPFRIQGLWSDYERQGQPGTDNASNFNWVIVSFNATGEAGTP